MPTLYTTALSANGRKPLAVANHLAIDVTVTSVNVYQGEGQADWYLAVNPWGKVPTLVDGELVLWESNAILVYMSEVYGDFALLSRDGRQRADILRWLFWESSQWQPVLNRVLAPRVRQLLFPDASAPPAVVAWHDTELERLMKVLGTVVDARGFICGSGVSLADFAIAGMTTYFPAADFPEHDYPSVAAWLRRMAEVEAWESTLVDPWRRVIESGLAAEPAAR
jgi:glutathione S-transferase